MAVAQTCTITPLRANLFDGRRLMKVTWDWSSATGGGVVAAGAVGVGTTMTHPVTGYLCSFHTKPDSGGTAPNAYTITLEDDDGRPVATKSGASTTAVENHASGHYLFNNTLDITVTGAGDGKGGTAWAYILY